MSQGAETGRDGGPVVKHVSPPDVLVVGSVNHDVVTEVERIPAPGETVRARAARRNLGGKGSNQAVAAARAGARTSLVARVGEIDADALRTEIAAYGVDVQGVRPVRDRTTGAAYITVADGENQIVVDPGANLAWDDDGHTLAAAASVAVTLTQLETPLEVAMRLARVARRLVLNAAPAAQLPRSLLVYCDPLVVNEHELGIVAGPTGRPVTEDGLVLHLMDRLFDLGVPSVVTTLGARGVVWRDDTGGGHQPPLSVKAVDSTGAGDAFTGFLAARLALGDPLAEAVRPATVAGALAVTRVGTHAACPSGRQVADAMTRLPPGRALTSAGVGR